MKNLKTSCLTMIMFLFICGNIYSQDIFLWLPNTSGDWTDASNWDHIVGTGTATYPGQITGGANADDIALFTSAHNGDCSIDPLFGGTTSALRIGGIYVEGYAGSIVQADQNRLIVADSYSGPLTTGLLFPSVPDIPGPLVGLSVHEASFNFGLGGSFIGSPSTVSTLTYSIAFYVPFTLNAGTFIAPKHWMLFRQDAVVNTSGPGLPVFNTTAFEGTVVLTNKSASGTNRNYSFPGVNFFDLRVASSHVSSHNFYEGSFNVTNDFYTTGLNGMIGTGSSSESVRMFSFDGTEVSIKGDLVVGNSWLSPSVGWSYDTSFGDLPLKLDGSGTQHIRTDYSSPSNFRGCLGSVTIDKPSGDTYVDGIVTINNKLTLLNGIVSPLSGTTTQENIVLAPAIQDILVLNDEATVIGANDNSFINGPIRKRKAVLFELPVGKGDVYRPIIMSPVSAPNHSNIYTVEYFKQTPDVGTSPFEAPLLGVSDCEVWSFEGEEGFSGFQFNLALSYDDSSCTSFLPAPVVIARWDQTALEWQSHGNGGAGTASNGDDTWISNGINGTTDLGTNSDLFTFGYDVEPECSIDGFIEYCVSGCEFTFGTVLELGLGTDITSYHWYFGDGEDIVLENPTHTYGMDGTYTVYVIVGGVNGDSDCSTVIEIKITVDCGATGMETFGAIQEESQIQLKLIPNPANAQFVKLELTTEETGSFPFSIFNAQGKVVAQGELGVEGARVDISKFKSGLYLVQTYVGNDRVTERLVIAN